MALTSSNAHWPHAIDAVVGIEWPLLLVVPWCLWKDVFGKSDSAHGPRSFAERIVWTDVKCLALANKSCQPGTNYKKKKKNTSEKWKKKNGSSLVKVSSSTRRYNNNKVNNNNNDNSNSSDNSNKHNNERGIIAKAFHMSSSFAFPLPTSETSSVCCVWWGVAQKLEIYLWSFCISFDGENTIQNETMYSLPLLSTPMPMRKGIEAL